MNSEDKKLLHNTLIPITNLGDSLWLSATYTHKPGMPDKLIPESLRIVRLKLLFPNGKEISLTTSQFNNFLDCCDSIYSACLSHAHEFRKAAGWKFNPNSKTWTK
jgi:hypothetical protein